MDAPNRWLFVPLHSGRSYRGKAGVPDPSTPQNEKKGTVPFFSCQGNEVRAGDAQIAGIEGRKSPNAQLVVAVACRL